MSLLFERHNGALNVNPPTGDDYALSVHGSDWLWTVTAIDLFLLLILIGLTYFARDGEKVFHYLFTISLFAGTISYYAMASDLGSTPIRVSDNTHGGTHTGTREIFYAKYINWFVGWPPLVIAIGLLSGVSWATIVFNIALVWTWIGSWLAGAVTATNYKWGFFAFGLIAEFVLAASLLHPGYLGAKRVGITRHYLPITGWLTFLWLLYPIAYGLDDGGNEISVTGGFIFFGILDVLTVPFLTFPFLFLARSWDYRALNLYFTQYGRVAQGGEFTEKAAPAPVAAPTTGVTAENAV
jgi:bacteriorhodopsin